MHRNPVKRGLVEATRSVAMEQLPRVFLWGVEAWSGSIFRVAPEIQRVRRRALLAKRRAPTHSQSTRMVGAPELPYGHPATDYGKEVVSSSREQKVVLSPDSSQLKKCGSPVSIAKKQSIGETRLTKRNIHACLVRGRSRGPSTPRKLHFVKFLSAQDDRLDRVESTESTALRLLSVHRRGRAAVRGFVFGTGLPAIALESRGVRRGASAKIAPPSAARWDEPVR